MTLPNCMPRPLLYSLESNSLGPEGCKVVTAVLDKTQITSLKCASHTLPSAQTMHVLCVYVLAFTSAAFDALCLPDAQRRQSCAANR